MGGSHGERKSQASSKTVTSLFPIKFQVNIKHADKMLQNVKVRAPLRVIPEYNCNTSICVCVFIAPTAIRKIIFSFLSKFFPRLFNNTLTTCGSYTSVSMFHCGHQEVWEYLFFLLTASFFITALVFYLLAKMVPQSKLALVLLNE